MEVEQTSLRNRLLNVLLGRRDFIKERIAAGGMDGVALALREFGLNLHITNEDGSSTTVLAELRELTKDRPILNDPKYQNLEALLELGQSVAGGHC